MLKQKSKTSVDLTKPILKVNNAPLKKAKEKAAQKTAEKNCRKYRIPYFFGYKTEFFPSKTIPKIVIHCIRQI